MYSLLHLFDRKSYLEMLLQYFLFNLGTDQPPNIPDNGIVEPNPEPADYSFLPTNTDHSRKKSITFVVLLPLLIE